MKYSNVSIGLFAALLLLGCPSDRDSILSSGVKRYSQFDEELIIRHFFDDRRDGVFGSTGTSLRPETELPSGACKRSTKRGSASHHREHDARGRKA